MMIFEATDDGMDVYEYKTYLGCIYKHEDGYCRFEPSADREPLSCKQLIDIANMVSNFNIDGA